MVKYAMAVAAVKAMENNLLNKNDIEQLISSTSKSAMESVLISKRGTNSENNSLEDVWKMLVGYAPECEELKILLYKNDFHNLKATLKAIISGKKPENYYIRPTNLDLDSLSKTITEKDYESLPIYLRETAEKAYELLTETLDGQLADSFIDNSALNAILKSAEDSKNEFMQKYAQITVACADIKTAYRCSKMNKSRSFMELAICGSPELEKDLLINEALKGTDELFKFLESTNYADTAKLLESSTAQFEKQCDDLIMELAKNSGMSAFGVEPLVAYYIASEAEFKNLRIISVCKECGTDINIISERMRMLYV